MRGSCLRDPDARIFLALTSPVQAAGGATARYPGLAPAALWGANQKGSPIAALAATALDPFTTYLIPVAR